MSSVLLILYVVFCLSVFCLLMYDKVVRWGCITVGDILWGIPIAAVPIINFCAFCLLGDEYHLFDWGKITIWKKKDEQ